MANKAFFKTEFERLAVGGFIGNPTGQLACAYIRVSSDEQADEGRSGLPRQIGHIHEAACKYSYKIPWEFVYADDSTGFEFEDRPELNALYRELESPRRRANAVVIEELDRLSRDADWHQGFLLHKFKRLGVEIVFWKAFNSLIERSVLGAISQQGMEAEKRRMLEGRLHKARSGRVTASAPAYGYKFVDSRGNEGFTAKKDTHYAIHEEEAIIVRRIFRRIINGDAMRRIALELELEGIKPPKRSKHWEYAYVRLIITNDTYKGDYYAHRWEHQKVQKPSKNGLSMRTVTTKVERPREEWIHVPVPAIVTAEEWEIANRMLEQNKKTARRNAKVPYLLTGLVKCAHCGWGFSGTTHRPYNKKAKPHWKVYRGYRCAHYSARPKYLSKSVHCHNSLIACPVLDGAVWKIVCQALLEPKLLLDALDADAISERNRRLEEQIVFLERELVSKNSDDEKLLRAYMAGAFDENEYAARRKLLKDEATRMSEELARLQTEVLTPEQLEQRKTMILGMSQQLQAQQLPIDPPFELKQRIIKLIVDEIVLNVTEGWLTVNGAIRGTFAIANTHAPAATSATIPNPAPVPRP